MGLGMMLVTACGLLLLTLGAAICFYVAMCHAEESRDSMRESWKDERKYAAGLKEELEAAREMQGESEIAVRRLKDEIDHLTEMYE